MTKWPGLNGTCYRSLNIFIAKTSLSGPSILTLPCKWHSGICEKLVGVAGNAPLHVLAADHKAPLCSFVGTESQLSGLVWRLDRCTDTPWVMSAAGLGTDLTPGSADKFTLLTTSWTVNAQRNELRRKQKFCVWHTLVNINYTIAVAVMRVGCVLPVAWTKHVWVTA